MQYYYLTAQGEQRGPIEVSEFANYGITAQTMVWCQGMASWQQAGNCPELAGVLATSTPSFTVETPPAPPASNVNEDGVKRPGSGLWFNIISWILATASFVCAIAIIVDGCRSSLSHCYYCNNYIYLSNNNLEVAGMLIVFTAILMLLLVTCTGIFSLVKAGKARSAWREKAYDKMKATASAGKLLAFIGLGTSGLYFVLMLIFALVMCD